QSVCACLHDRAILVGFHGADLQRDAGKFVVQSADTFSEVTTRDKLRVFSGHKQDVSEALSFKGACFPQYVVHGQRDAQNRIIARKAAILAVVDALVGEIERRKQADDFTEALLREGVRFLADGLKQFASRGRNQVRKVRQSHNAISHTFPHRRRGRRSYAPQQRIHWQGVKLGDKTHAKNVTEERWMSSAVTVTLTHRGSESDTAATASCVIPPRPVRKCRVPPRGNQSAPGNLPCH